MAVASCCLAFPAPSPTQGLLVLLPRALAFQVPDYIHRLPLAALEKQKQQRRREIGEAVRGKYTPEQEFKLHETKSTVDKVRAEVEAARNAELKFEGVKAKPVG